MTRDDLWDRLRKKYSLRAIVSCDRNGGCSYRNQMPWQVDDIDADVMIKTTGKKIIVQREFLPYYAHLKNYCTMYTDGAIDLHDLLNNKHTETEGNMQFDFEGHYQPDDGVMYVLGASEILEETVPFLDEVDLYIVHGDWACDKTLDLDSISWHMDYVKEHSTDNSIQHFTYSKYMV